MSRDRRKLETSDRLPDPPIAPFSDEPDATLVEEMLSLKISDRLRTLSRYADVPGRFRPV
jgi:hypothetical protein